MAHRRLDGGASPRVVTARAGMLVVDAAGGTAQAAFDSVCDDLVSRARENGIAMLSIHRSFTAGEIGHYTTRLAEQGLVALVGSNSPALVAALGAREAVTGTNPLSFALPHPDGPRMFDQAASATAWVNIRDAADRGEAIPAGWALAPDGEETIDAQAGMNGALLRLIEEMRVGDVTAVVPTVTGRAWITAIGQQVADPTDPFPAGCTV